MIETLNIVGIITILILVWLNFLSTIAVKHDHFLNSFQRKAQYVVIWLFPFLGACTILFLVYQHSPNAIPKGWIPWPFKVFIFGKEPKRNRNRGSGSGHDSAGGGGYDSGGGDGGGD